MRRIRLHTSKKIALTAAAVSAVSIAAAGGTYANFTATPVTISNNAFAAGTLEMDRSGSGAVFSAAGMAIGDDASGSVTITNSGSLAGEYALSGSASGDLAPSLDLVIYKDNDGQAGSKIYDGALDGLRLGRPRRLRGRRRQPHLLLPRLPSHDRVGRRRQRPPGQVGQRQLHLVGDPGVSAPTPEQDGTCRCDSRRC